MSAEPQHWVVDVIEEGSVSLELPDGKTINLPLALLPKGVRSGQIVRVTIEVDEDATRRALEQSAAQVKKGMDASRKRDPGGDIVL